MGAIPPSVAVRMHGFDQKANWFLGELIFYLAFQRM
jgi:hypothetical protein